MRISPADLMAEWRRSVASWPFLADVEATYRLPRCLLVAVGSRETNMTNEVGDGGHGHGVWQYDDRSHTIPAGFDGNVRAQADMAAKMLRGLIGFFQGNIRAALDAYNAGAGAVRNALAAGRDPDTVTTGRDYGSDVLERMTYLQTATNPAAPPPVVHSPIPPSSPPVHVTVNGEPCMIQTVNVPIDTNGNGKTPTDVPVEKLSSLEAWGEGTYKGPRAIPLNENGKVTVMVVGHTPSAPPPADPWWAPVIVTSSD